jgi:hypothetical protein
MESEDLSLRLIQISTQPLNIPTPVLQGFAFSKSLSFFYNCNREPHPIPRHNPMYAPLFHRLARSCPADFQRESLNVICIFEIPCDFSMPYISCNFFGTLTQTKTLSTIHQPEYAFELKHMYKMVGFAHVQKNVPSYTIRDLTPYPPNFLFCLIRYCLLTLTNTLSADMVDYLYFSLMRVI